MQVAAEASYKRALYLDPSNIDALTGAISSIRQHTSAYVSIRQHMSAYISIREHTLAYVSYIHALTRPLNEDARPQVLSG